MRAALGLSAPERRIGQTAHDFVAALGAREAILSRAKKRGGAPTVASRFLQRMGAVAGEAAYGEACARGDALARPGARDRQAGRRSRRSGGPSRARRWRCARTSLSVTRIETLRRDPYAIYAERILKLKPLEPIGATPGPREIGNEWHAALSAFAEAFPERRPACRRARGSDAARARAFRAAARRSRVSRLGLAARRTGARLFPRFRSRPARHRRAHARREGRRADDPARRRRDRSS